MQEYSCILGRYGNTEYSHKNWPEVSQKNPQKPPKPAKKSGKCYWYGVYYPKLFGHKISTFQHKGGAAAQLELAEQFGRRQRPVGCRCSDAEETSWPAKHSCVFENHSRRHRYCPCECVSACRLCGEIKSFRSCRGSFGWAFWQPRSYTVSSRAGGRIYNIT